MVESGIFDTLVPRDLTGPSFIYGPSSSEEGGDDASVAKVTFVAMEVVEYPLAWPRLRGCRFTANAR